MRATATRTTRLGLTVTSLIAATALTACSSSGNDASSGTSRSTASSTSQSPSNLAPALASASVGSLVITGGYIPQPASPDVAAAYLTITNNGDTADKLEKVTSSVTSMVMAMNETDSNGVGTMTDLPNVTIPAHGSMQFVPNHAHLMLENPKPLKAGNEVVMTLTFTHAGTVQITVPVIPLTDTPITVPTQMTVTPSGGGSAMPGMNMTGSSMSGTSMSGS